MIAEAKRLATEGRAVYVIAKHWQHLQDEIDREVPGRGIKCEPDVPLLKKTAENFISDLG